MARRNRVKRATAVVNESARATKEESRSGRQLIEEEQPSSPHHEQGDVPVKVSPRVDEEPTATELASPPGQASPQPQATSATAQVRLVENLTCHVVKLAARGLFAAERTLSSAAEWFARQAKNVEAYAARLT